MSEWTREMEHDLFCLSDDWPESDVYRAALAEIRRLREVNEELTKGCAAAKAEAHARWTVQVALGQELNKAQEEIRRLREERDRAEAKAELFQRDWYEAKAEFGQSQLKLRSAGARAMQEMLDAAMYAGGTEALVKALRAAKPEDV